MIRLLFAVFVTVGAFLAAALWIERGGAPRSLVEARELVEPVADEIEARAASLAEAAAEALAAERPDAGQSARPPSPRPRGSRAADAQAEPEPVVEAVISETRSAPFVEAEAVREPAGAAASDAKPQLAVSASVADQDAWAERIRRMLDVYRRASAYR